MSAEGYKVELWVFDITGGMARVLSQSLLGQQIDGVWHTSIVVYNTEYLYGGGIQGVRPGTTAAGNAPYKKVFLGHTPKSQSQFHTFLNSKAEAFSPGNYDLLKHNCNNFTDEAAVFLLGKKIPAWITGLPEQVLRTPLGDMIRPMLETLQSNLTSALPGMQGMFVRPQLPIVNPAFSKEFSFRVIPESKDEKEDSLFKIGDRVMLCGLKTAVYNGKTGEINGHRMDTGRWPVLLDFDKSTKAFKPLNLRHVSRKEEKPCPYESLRGLKPISNVDENEDRYTKLIIKHGKLSNEEKVTLENLTKFIKQKELAPVPTEYIDLFKNTMLRVPMKALFSLLALFRNFVSKKRVRLVDFGFLKKVQDRIPKENQSVMIVFVTACANLVVQCVTDGESAVEIATDALDSENKHIRTAGALLTYNLCLSLPEDSEDSQMALCCALGRVVGQEKIASILNRSLLAIGLLIRDDEMLAQLLAQMEVNFEEIRKVGTEKTEKIVKDLLTIIERSSESDELSI